MENQLDLDIIIKFLNNNINEIKSISSSEKLQHEYLDFYNSKNFNKFNNIFKNNIDRVGIHKNNINNNSLYFTVLFLLYETFKELNNDSQNLMINKLIESILSNKNFDKINKENINIYKLSCFFNINIFLFSYSTNSITIFYKENKFIKYKKNIFINEINGSFYPLMYTNGNGSYFKYNSPILQCILDSPDNSIFSINDNKQFMINEDWNEILDEFNNIDIYNIIEYLDDSESKDSDDEINFSNLSEKLEDINIKINNEKKKEDNDIIDDLVSNDEDKETIKIIKNTTVSKLKKLKKEVLIEYYDKLIKDSGKTKSLNKDIIIKCLKEKVISIEI